MAEETAKTAVLLEEKRLFHPPKDLVENSNVMHWMKKKGFKTEKEMREWCSKNYVEFWDEMAKTYADWFEPYKQVLDWKPPMPSGLWAESATWPITLWTDMRSPGGGIK